MNREEIIVVNANVTFMGALMFGLESPSVTRTLLDIDEVIRLLRDEVVAQQQCVLLLQDWIDEEIIGSVLLLKKDATTFEVCEENLSRVDGIQANLSKTFWQTLEAFFMIERP